MQSRIQPSRFKARPPCQIFQFRRCHDHRALREIGRQKLDLVACNCQYYPRRGTNLLFVSHVSLATFKKLAISASLWLTAQAASTECLLISCVRLEALILMLAEERNILKFGACREILPEIIFHLYPAEMCSQIPDKPQIMYHKTIINDD